MFGSFGFDRVSAFFSQARDEAKADAYAGRAGGVRFQSAIPFRPCDIDRPDTDTVSLGILDQSRRTVKTHGPCVQESTEKGGWMVAFEIRRRIGD